MKKLRELLKRIAALKKELAEFNLLEEKTRDDILQIARSDIPLPMQQQKIRDARLTLDLVDAKRSKIENPLGVAIDELKDQFMVCISAWNSAIKGVIQQSEEQLINLTIAHFNGDARACRRWWEAGRFNESLLLNSYKDSFYHTSSLREVMSRNLFGTVQHFLNFTEEKAPVIGLTSDDLAKM